MQANDQPNCCPICGETQILDTQFRGSSCTDPAHWQAAGLLSPRDYYPLARIAAQARVKTEAERGTTP